MSLPRTTAADLHSARAALASGRASAAALLAAARAAAAAPGCENAFIRRFDDQAAAAAEHADALRAAGAAAAPLAGLAVSVKDLFDVAGMPTTAGSQVLADAAPAAADSPVVARLRAAGAALVGHTNLSEFAFSGLGINPHHGTPANPACAAVDPRPRVPGGSTSGGATSVARGAAWAALGSDTGGSIRIPAAFQGLVGFKNTQRLTPLDGSVPLSTTLDTACAITRSVRDAILLHEILAARTVRLPRRPLGALRFALPTTSMLDDLEPEVAAAFDAAVGVLRAAGAQIDEIALPPLAELASINAQGGFAAAESWFWHRPHLEAHADAYDPRVALRIRRGAAMSAADYLGLVAARRRWIAAMEAALQGYDGALSPTVPMRAPPLQPLLDSDEAFFAANARALRNPSAINFLDGCAISLPCQAAGALPVGLMVWGPAMTDDVVLGAALQIEGTLAGGRP
jgi:aspartyl-tRNA(Asn)/glutamyl-tRNA(Gln) amidotransferase subunit A